MKKVQQKDRSGCVIACIATLAGTSYAKVRKLFLEIGGDEFRLKAVGNGAGVTAGEATRLCELLNIAPPLTKAPCLIVIKRQWGSYIADHCVVVTERGRVIDPGEEAMKKKPLEIHINTRGCKKPIDKRTAAALGEAMLKLHAKISKEQRKKRRGRRPQARAARRELINTGRDKRYVRRDRLGRFAESDDVGRSLAADRRQKAKHKAKRGQGDRGDR